MALAREDHVPAPAAPAVRPVPAARIAARARHPWINLGVTERVISGLWGGALALAGWRRRDPLGIGVATLGGLLLLRGASGVSLSYRLLGLSPSVLEKRAAAERGWTGAVVVECGTTIHCPADELYRFWRDFANLPRFMRHVERVDVLSERRSHWVVRAPAGMQVEWDAEIEGEQPDHWIAWRSVEGADVRNAGSVSFREIPGDRGTEVLVRLSYEPPLGQPGRLVAKLTGEAPRQQVRDDLRRFKQLMEAGEIPTVHGQPSGRR